MHEGHKNINRSGIIETIFPDKIKPGDYLISPPLNNKKSLETFFEKNPQPQIVIDKAYQSIENLQFELNHFPDPKVSIDFTNGKINLLPYKLFFNTKDNTNIFIPTGISIALISSEKDIIGIQRSKNNDLCPGYLGTPAAYMSFPSKNNLQEDFPDKIDINKLIYYNIFKTMSREFGINISEESDMAIYGIINVKHPLDQQELLVLLESNLPTRIIKLLANQNSSNKDILIPEPNVISLNSDQLDKIIEDKKIPMANQHQAALLLASYASRFGSKELKQKRYVNINTWINDNHSIN